MITTQGLIDGLDKTTVDGFAEALLIAMTELRDDQNRRLLVRLSNDMDENIRFSKNIAKMMLKAREGEQ